MVENSEFSMWISHQDQAQRKAVDEVARELGVLPARNAAIGIAGEHATYDWAELVLAHLRSMRAGD